MKTNHIVALLVFATGLVMGCSDVGFESIPVRTCEKNQDRDTKCKPGAQTNTYTFTFRSGEVDILFVDDNSGSMYAEQQRMADAFPNFLSRISNLFYRIAITTTDISASPNNSAPREANGNGAFQDGKFLEFKTTKQQASGLTVIDEDTANAEELFRGTIQRQETLTCDKSGFAATYCPSSDERGIYAANLAINRGASNFFRTGAHLAVVILTDENERGDGGSTTNPLEINDLPETLVLNLKQKYPTKSLSVHAVMVRPGDLSCLSAQTQLSPNGIYTTRGKYGTVYAQLTNPSADLFALGNILPGVQGSICDPNYGAQLGDIGANIRDNTLDSPKKLNCNPDPSTISIFTEPAGYESQIQYAVDATNSVYFNNVPIGVEVTFKYECSKYR